MSITQPFSHSLFFAPTGAPGRSGGHAILPPSHATGCRLCGSHHLEHWHKQDAKSGAPLPVAFCQTCGLVQQRALPQEAALAAYYTHHYRLDYKRTHQPHPRHVRRAGVTALDRLALLGRWLPASQTGRSLLDVGAGGGEFVYLAARQGFAARGVEPNEGYSAFAREAYGVDVATGVLHDVADGSADLVSLFHVFEHLPRPLEAMAQIARILRPGGMLFLEVPNILQSDASPHNVFFGAHLFYYSRQTLEAAASPCFETVQVDDQGNLKMLLRRRDTPLPAPRLPDASVVADMRARIAKKGWWEYLTRGGALAKPGRRLAQRLAERKVRRMAPRDILDQLRTRRPVA